MLDMATPRKSRTNKPPKTEPPEPPKRPNRTGKALHCYIDPALRDTIADLSAAIDVDLTMLTETALRLLLNHMGWGPMPDRLWLALKPKKTKE